MIYSDAVLWRNKYNNVVKTLDESLKHNMKLIDISNVLKVNDFSHEYKIALIEAIIKREV